MGPFAIIVVIVAVAAGCASTSSKRQAIAEADAVFVGEEVAAYVSTKLPAASSTLWVALPPADKKGHRPPLADAVPLALRSRGFAVAEGLTAESAAHQVTYDAMPADDGLLLTVNVDGVRASRWYARAEKGGQLAAASSFTVKVTE